MTLTEPQINATVTVDVAGWRTPRRTRVEDLDDEVVVAAPVREAGNHEPSLGTVLELSWQSSRGPVSLQVRLVAKELRTVPTWRLEPRGPVVVTQRRHHVRARTLMPVVLRTPDGPFDAQVVDLSEGGLRVVHRGTAPLAVGDRLHAELQVSGRYLLFAAEVVRLEADHETWCAGCRFTAVLDSDADAVRRFVFERQAQARVR